MKGHVDLQKVDRHPFEDEESTRPGNRPVATRMEAPRRTPERLDRALHVLRIKRTR